MSEAIKNPLDDVEAQNRELLAKSEIGPLLDEAYTAALNVAAISGHPRLAEAVFVEMDPDSTSFAQARPAWTTESGKYEVAIRTQDLDAIFDKFAASLDQIPGARETFATIMEVEPEEVTPQNMYVFSMLHEMGHINEYMDNEDDPQAYAERNRRDKAALPIARVATSQIIDPDSPVRAAIEKHWDDVSAATGAQDMDHLAQLQHDAYRAMPAERYADAFAQTVYLANPSIADRLGNADINNYRMPTAA